MVVQSSTRGVPKAANVWRFEARAFSDGARLIHHLAVQRLKTRSQFQAVLAGDKVAATAHFVLHRCTLDAGSSRTALKPTGLEPRALLFAPAGVWLGAMVPKRWAKRAVTRNTIKRQIYNVSSEFEPALQVAAHVVRLRAGFDRARFFSASSDALKLAVRKELVQLFCHATRDLAVGRLSSAAQ